MTPIEKLALRLAVIIMLASGAMTVVLSSHASSDDFSPDEILKKAQETYASLSSYSDEGKIVATMNGTVTTTTFTMRLARTNFYHINWQQRRESYSTINAGVQTVWSAGAGNFLELGYGNGPQNEMTREIALSEASALSAGAAATIPMAFFTVPWGDGLGDSASEDRKTDGNVGGINCYVLDVKAQGQKKKIWIGKQDFLIHQIQTLASAEAIWSKAAKWDPEIIADAHAFTSTETHANIVVNKEFSRSDFIPSNGE